MNAIKIFIRHVKHSVSFVAATLRGAVTRSLFVLLIGGVATAMSYAAIPAGERAVLQSFFNSTNGNAWTTKTNWNGPAGTECTWFGITCNAAQSHVITLVVPRNALSGVLPTTLNQLSALQSFNADDNQLTGAIPPIGGLTELRAFTVGNNLLSGSIPPLVALPSLSFFHAHINQLTGSIPSLSALSALSDIDISQNQLTGPIPSLTGLSTLQFFSVFSNQLSGPLPSLAGLVALSGFQANANQLSGPIPPLAGLSSLTFFNVSVNQFTGSIPALTGLTKLQTFNVFFNQLTGPMPPLTGLSALQRFLISSNQLTGPVPSTPSPSVLVAEGSRLCPNQLTASPNAFWDAATPNATWDTDCSAALPQQVLSFSVVPTLIVNGTGTVVATVVPSPGSNQPIVYSSLSSGVCAVDAATGAIAVLPGAAIGNVCTIAADKANDQTINSAVQVRQSITIAAGFCRLDVNGDQSQSAAIDGMMITRYLSGIRGNALIEGLTLTGSRNNAQSVESFLAAQNFDVQGNGATTARATRDGLVITRFLRNVAAAAMIAGTDIAATQASNVRDRISAWCTP
jgi:Leucine rich repeat N-terminal domain